MGRRGLGSDRQDDPACNAHSSATCRVHLIGEERLSYISQITVGKLLRSRLLKVGDEIRDPLAIIWFHRAPDFRAQLFNGY